MIEAFILQLLLRQKHPVPYSHVLLLQFQDEAFVDGDVPLFAILYIAINWIILIN